MNIITGCLSATAGTVRIGGHDIYEEPDAAKRCIGYLPEHPPLYLNDTPLEYLRFVAEAKGLRGGELHRQVASSLDRTGTEAVKNRRISELSKGYRQRVGIAQALLGDPQVIILDEPTVGLDPLQIIEIRELIRSLGETHTVIFSSHILSEVQTICDQILMIVGGRLVAFGSPEELQSRLLAPSELTVTTDAPESALESILGVIDGITNVSVGATAQEQTVLHIQSGHDNIYDLSAAVFRAFAGSEWVIYEMNAKRGGLEDVFLELSEQPEPPVEAEETEEAQ